MGKRKRESAEMKKPRAELRYYQQMYRVELRSLRAGKRKMQAIAKKMMDFQNESI